MLGAFGTSAVSLAEARAMLDAGHWRERGRDTGSGAELQQTTPADPIGHC